VDEMSNWDGDPGQNRERGVAFTLSFGVPVADRIERSFRLDRRRTKTTGVVRYIFVRRFFTTSETEPTS